MRQFLLTCLLLIVSSLVFAQQTPDEQLAIQYYKDGEYEKAAELFDKINLTKKNSYIYYYHFQTLYELRDFDKLEKLVKKQIKLFPDQQRYKVDLGFVYEISNQPGKAEKEYQSTLKDLAAKDYSIKDLYSAFLSKGKREYALNALLKGRMLMNDNKLYTKEITGIYSQLGQTDKLFEEALALVQDNNAQFLPQAEEIIQNALADDENQQKYLNIKTLLQKNMQKYPENDCYTLLLTWVYQVNKDFPEALILAKALDKKNQEDGSRLVQLAVSAEQNRNYEVAIEALNYVVAKGPDSPQYDNAINRLLNIKYKKISTSYPVNMQEVNGLEKEYQKFVAEKGIASCSTELILKYSSLLAFYQNKIDEATKLLEDAIKNASRDQKQMNEYKVQLADILLYSNNIWDATLLYSQVDKDMPNDEIGQTAKFKNAKLSFYIGEFAWAKSQLDVLRAATSKLIANDAMYFSLLISDNEEEDEEEDGEEEDTLLFSGTVTNIPLQYYAKADFLLFQNKVEEAYTMFDSVITLSPFGTLVDDALYQKALILIRKKDFISAEQLLRKIEESHYTELLADDALFKLGELYEYYIHDPNKAMECYRKLLRDFPSSLYVNDARNRFRALRGDH
jgi:tetratricopeptide (TPR) repeat protein